MITGGPQTSLASFDSPSAYFKFAGAREFWNKESNNTFSYKKNLLEKIGDVLVFPTLGTANFFIKNSLNPLMVLAVSVALVFAATLVFYPATVTAAITYVLPQIFMIEPWMVHLTGFLFAQLSIFGAGMRTYGRIVNKDLASAWNDKNIFPITIGTRIVKTDIQNS